MKCCMKNIYCNSLRLQKHMQLEEQIIFEDYATSKKDL